MTSCIRSWRASAGWSVIGAPEGGADLVPRATDGHALVKGQSVERPVVPVSNGRLHPLHDLRSPSGAVLLGPGGEEGSEGTDAGLSVPAPGLAIAGAPPAQRVDQCRHALRCQPA